NLPDLRGKFPLGAGPANALGSTGGSYTVTIAIGNLPVHAHSIIDIAHGHGVNQWAHAHNIATGGHSQNITTRSHSHGLTQSVGLSYPTSGGAGAQTVTSGAGPIRTDTAGNL